MNAPLPAEKRVGDCIGTGCKAASLLARIENLCGQLTAKDSEIERLRTGIRQAAADRPMSAMTRHWLRELAGIWTNEQIAKIHSAADELGKHMVMGKPTDDVEAERDRMRMLNDHDMPY